MPAVVLPKPLIRGFPHPVLDDSMDHNVGGVRVDPAIGRTGKLKRGGEFGEKPPAGKVNHARAMNRAFEVAREDSDDRVAPGGPSKKRDLHAFPDSLIDDHAEMRSF